MGSHRYPEQHAEWYWCWSMEGNSCYMDYLDQSKHAHLIIFETETVLHKQCNEYSGYSNGKFGYAVSGLSG